MAYLRLGDEVKNQGCSSCGPVCGCSRCRSHDSRLGQTVTPSRRRVPTDPHRQSWPQRAGSSTALAPGQDTVNQAIGNGAQATEYDGVFEGGGAKGIAFVGALALMEAQGKWFKRVAGTSAGAITAALVAAGYRARMRDRGATLEDIVFNTHFQDFLDAPRPEHFTDEELERSQFYQMMSAIPPLLILPRAARLSLLRNTLLRVPAIALLLNLFSRGGLFAGDVFRRWINEKIRTQLQRLSPGTPISEEPTFAEVTQRTGIGLSLIASDIGNHVMRVFSDRLTPRAKVADAVRMSMSIPIIFSPFMLQGCPIVDGGLLSNYPMFLFTRPEGNSVEEQRRPKIGFLLDEMNQPGGQLTQACPPQTGIPGIPAAIQSVAFLGGFLGKLLDTMMEAFDRRATGGYARDTVRIDVRGYGTLDFSMSMPRKLVLAQRGWAATASYFRNRGVTTIPPSPYPGP